VRKLRQEDPSFSSIKIAKILLRDFGIKISAATIGRIIRKFNLFLSRIIVMNKQRSVRLSRTWKIRREKYRKPYGLKAIAPHQIIEFDMKHIKLGNGTRQYAFCAIDPYTKEAVVHIASRPSSSQARVALDKVLERFGKDVTILNDNDSENMGKAYDYLKGQDITQLFARPYEPKDKPYVENFIGKYQKECLNESLGDPMSVAERQAEADKWVRKWHFYRPHQSLEYQTPAEFCATLGITIPHGNLSTM
jgi:transposase InsO family protein